MAAETNRGVEDQVSTIELLWGLRPTPNRGPKPTLSLDRIAQVAVDIADADGLGAVSMQHVAHKFDVTKMALYRYVASKAQLLAVMIEQAVGDPPNLSRVRRGWRPKLEAWARRMWATWDRHPWLPEVTTGDRVMGPKELGWTECAVGALAGTGLHGREQMDAVFVLSGHIRNTRSIAAAGTQPWTSERQLALLRQHGDRFSAVMAAVAPVVGAARHDAGSAREFGLRRILDGLELLIATRSSDSG
ncbi:MAG: TetR/AcrR family transcriptional regulator [Acidimicrobiales bacterium]